MPAGARLIEVSVEGADASFLLLAAGDEHPVAAEPSPMIASLIAPPTSMPTPVRAAGAGPQSQLVHEQLAKCETLADVALRSAHRFREAGDPERAAEYEVNAEAFANRAIKLRHEIDELERG